MRNLAVVMALLAALSGCSDPEPKPTVDADDQDLGGNTTIPEEPRAVHLTALLNASASNGSAPLAVTFEAGATGTIDPVWAVDFGDGSAPVNGSELPSTVEHTYNSSGVYPAVLTVTDGDVVSYAYVNITVTETTLLPIQTTPFSYSVGTVNCPDPGDMDLGTPANGVLWAEFAIAPESAGQGFAVSWPTPNTVFVLGFMAFYQTDGTLIDFTYAGGGDVTGTVPLGAEVGVFSDCLGGPIEGTFSTTGTLPVDE